MRADHALEQPWTAPDRAGWQDRKRQLRTFLGIVALGFAVGSVGIMVGSFELRWIVMVFAVLLGGFTIAVVRDRERLLTAVFLLSLQIDVYVRLLHGRAGTAGLELPLSFCVASALWLQMYQNQATRGAFVWFGRLRRPITALIVTTMLSLILTTERFAGIGRLFFELQLILIYSLALNFVLRDESVWPAMRYLAATLGIQAVICIIQSRLGVTFSLVGEVTELGEVPRPGGTVSTNPAGFASFVMPLITVVSARFVSRSRQYRGRADALLAVLGITAVILTVTRAAWGALVLGVGYIIVVGIRRRYITGRQIVFILIALVVAFVAAAPLMQERLQSSPMGDSYDERARLNEIAIGVILHNPVFGVGAGAYDFMFKQYLPSGADAFWLAGVHNEYLMRTAETGIPGGIAFVWVLLVGFSQARALSRSRDPGTYIFGLGWAAGLLALAWQMYWVPWRGFAYNSILWLFLGLAEGLEILERRRAEAEPGAAAGALPPRASVS